MSAPTSSHSRGWPFVGHFFAFRADAPGFLRRIAGEQGDVARFRLGRRDAFLLTHPDMVRRVLVDHADAFVKGRLMQRARRLLGDGLLTSEAQLHHTQRRRIQPVFSRERLQGYGAQVPSLVASAVSGWRRGAVVRVDAEMDALAMRMVARTLLGADIEDEVPELFGALRRLSRWAPLLAAPGGRLLERTRLPFLGRLRQAIDVVERIIDRRIAEGGSCAPLLGALVDSMPHGLVRDEVMTIFLAGHDTTAASLMWTWLLLGAHPEVERRLGDELSVVLGDRLPEPADIAQLPFTDMVVREVLRLYPPIGRIGRRPIDDLDLGSVVLPRGAAVFVSPFVTQRDARWFDEPDAFRPDRWAEPAPERPRFAWFPFGAGPRSCIGEHFARMMLVLTIATIARSWRLQPTRDGLPGTRSLLTLKPRGAVWMVAESKAVPCPGVTLAGQPRPVDEPNVVTTSRR